MRKSLLAFIREIAAPAINLGKYLLLGSILFLAFWIRIQMVDQIPEGQFLGNDSYLYYWQAMMISEQGQLPARDMHRWLPLGRDLGQTLNLYSYALVYTHKGLSFLFPSLSLYQVTIYAPAVCFVIGLTFLCMFLYQTHGALFSCIVALLLATFPGTISRSTAGFSDRDSWCLMLGIFSVFTYLISLRTRKTHKRFLWTLAAGVSTFLGGMSWEGFGVFLSVLLVVEVWRFLSSEKEKDLVFYLIWILTFVPILYLASPAYRSGQGFSTHIAAFMLMPPIVLFGLRAIRILLISKVKSLFPHGRMVALVLTLAGIGIAIGYASMQFDTFASTTVPFGRNRLMQSIGELQPPHYSDWIRRYGNLFIVGSIGLITATVQLCKKNGTLFVFPVSLFILTTFFQYLLNHLLGSGLTYNLFLGSIALVILISLAVPYLKRTRTKNEIATVACVTWFVLWLTLARDARRYDFFVGLPIAYFAAHILITLSKTIGEKLRHSEYASKKFRRDISTANLSIVITLIIFFLLIFWVPPGKQTERFHHVTTHIRQKLPDNPHLEKAFQWMKTHIPLSVVASSWNDGSQLNVLGGVKTIIDPDHYLQHWIHLYNRHVFCARSNQEALEFLKTHGATHLLLYANDLIYHANSYSNIGSDENGDIRWNFTPLRRQLPKDMKYRMVSDLHADIPLESIEFETISENTILVKAQLKTGESVHLPAVVFINKRRIIAENENEHGGVVIIFDEYQQPATAYYIPAIGWDSLAVRLYFRGDIPDIFVPVYPIGKNPTAHVKVWEIHYPPDIRSNPKYLATKPEE